MKKCIMMRRCVLSRAVLGAVLILIAVCLSCGALAGESGECGENAAWVLDDSGLLKISGSGDIYDGGWKHEEIIRIVISEGITGINDWTFNECLSLTEVSLPDGLTDIRDAAFYHCEKLNSINLPQSVKRIGEFAFNSCPALKTVTVPDGLSAVGEWAFDYEAERLVVNIGSNGAKALGKAGYDFYVRDLKTRFVYTFSGDQCIGLEITKADSDITSLSVSDRVTSISGWAFNDCSLLTAVSFSDGLTDIGDAAFYHCEKLKSVSLPQSVKSIGGFAFADCPALKTISIPDGLSSVGEWAFDHDGKRYTVIGSEGAKALGKAGYDFYVRNLKICFRYIYSRDQCSGLEVTRADKGLTTISIPDGVTGIGEWAFSDCKLSYLNIPDSVVNMTVSSLAGVGRSFHIECNPKSYAEKFAKAYGFQYKNGKKEVIGYTITSLDEKVKWILSHYVSSSMSEKEKVRAIHNWLICNAHYDGTYSNYEADGVIVKGYGVCDSYSKAAEVLLTKTGIANRRIWGADHAWNLVRVNGQWYHMDVTWDDPGWEELDAPVISGYEHYKYFLVNDSQMKEDHQWDLPISADDNQVGVFNDNGDQYYYGTEGHYRLDQKENTAVFTGPVSRDVTDLKIPSSITAESVTYTVTGIEADACTGMTGLETVIIGKSVSCIGKNAFSGCSKLKAVSFGQGLTSIGASAFLDCGRLSDVTIPSGVTDIGSRAFDGCTNLKSIFLSANVTSIGSDAFDHKTVISAPEGSYAAQWAKENGYKLQDDSQVYTVAVVTEGKGEASADPASGAEGTEVVLTAAPDDGWQFKGWEVISGGVEIVGDRFIIRSANVEIKAVFVPDDADLTDIKGAEISAIRDQVYTGKAIKPKVTVKFDGKKLTRGTDYTVSYRNNKAVGTATVTVTGKGSYTGSVRKTFKINPKPVVLSSLKAGKKQLTVKWKKGSGITGYEIQYSLKKDFTGAKKVIVKKSATSSKVIRKLTKGKTYYVRIRAYKTVKGKKYYSSWSEAMKKKVK